MRIRALVSATLLLVLCAAHAHAASVTLAWDASPSPGVIGYRIEYGLASGLYDSAINLGNVTQGDVPDLIFGVTYYFAVTAYDSSFAESPPSNEVTWTASSLPALPPPIIDLRIALLPGG